MPFLIAPMCTDGKLTGYAYISSKVVTSSREASLDVRNKIPFIQDAFVRDVNATPITKATDPKTVDNAGLIARLTADVKRIGVRPRSRPSSSSRSRFPSSTPTRPWLQPHPASPAAGALRHCRIVA